LTLLPLLAVLGLAAFLALLGSRLGGVLAGPRDGGLYRLVLYSLAGWVGLHLLLTAMTLAGLRWRLLPLAAAAVILFALFAFAAARFLPRAAERPRPLSAVGWGEAAALAALAVFTVVALSLWATNPDFVYHWGIKGHRFFMAGGIDYSYLVPGWHWVLHPDYPNLLPELFAVSAVAAGRFDEAAMMLWSPICCALLLAAVREALRRAEVCRFLAQSTLAVVALILAAYGIGGMSTGGADWLIALALAAALPPLLSPADRRGAAQIGLVAAFAAGSKVEGLPLAAGLIAVYAVRWGRAALAAREGATEEGGRTLGDAFKVAVALAVPAIAVVAPWAWAVRRYHLFQTFNSGPFEPSRLPQVLATVAETLQTPAWHGFAYTLFLLPLLALDRRARAAGAVICLQLLFYFYVYLSVRLDPVFLILSSFGRLVLHLLPALITALVVVLDGFSARRSAAESA
jgi:hypothetical protein